MMGSLYDVYELIGEGSFGKVYRARCNRTNTQVAYKVISKTGRSVPEVYALRRECEIQKSLWHPNIIRMLHSFENDEELVVITEFAEKDLCHIIREKGALGEHDARKIICDLVSALFYLHSYRILHRDLKPQNVLIDSSGNAKLCDFGFAKVLCKDSQMLTSIKGTPLYMAPELMHEHPYDHNADLWSLGCIAYELITGRPPYPTSSILQLINMVKLQPINWPHYSSEPCLSFLKGLLNKNPFSRLTWPHLLYHPFIVPNITRNLPHTFNNPPGQLSHEELSSFTVRPLSYPHRTNIQVAVQNSAECENNKYVPSHIIKIKDRQVKKSVDSCSPKSTNRKENLTDFEAEAQKEEWLECLKKTISSLMYDGDVDELIEKHSLKLIMNTFSTYSDYSVIVLTVARLLSLPFVVESVSDSQLVKIIETYASCNVLYDLSMVVKKLVSKTEKKKLRINEETALQQILSLTCTLVYSDMTLLQQFHEVCVSLNLIQDFKSFLLIRTKEDPLSVVNYVISIFTRLFIVVPQSRDPTCEAFEGCVAEFHSLLRKTADMKVHLRLCTFLSVLGSTRPNCLRQSPSIDTLINDLNKLSISSTTPSTRQVITDTLEVLKSVNHAR